MDAGSGTTLYHVTTKTGLKYVTTTLSTASGEVVGIWDQKAFKHSDVTFHGQRSKLSDWLPTKSTLSRYVTIYIILHYV